MREILFRGKKMDNWEWVEGYYLKHDSVKVCFSSDDPKTKHLIAFDDFCDWGFEPPIHAVEVQPETIGQYTGLNDKNGKRIFEGDIVEAVLPPTVAQPGFVWPKMRTVFVDGAFGLLDQRNETIPFRSFSPRVTFEIKGNIHDNLELLKGDTNAEHP